MGQIPLFIYFFTGFSFRAGIKIVHFVALVELYKTVCFDHFDIESMVLVCTFQLRLTIIFRVLIV